jgi:hypothetical protein
VQLIFNLTGDQADLRNGDGAMANFDRLKRLAALSNCGDQIVLVPESF